MTTTNQRLTQFRNQVLHIEPSPRWIRGISGGTTVVDSRHASSSAPRRLAVAGPSTTSPPKTCAWTCSSPPAPQERPAHRRSDLLQPEGRRQVVEDAAWSFGEPFASEDVDRADAPDLRGYVAFEWDKIESWFEEAEEIFRHPRDPYKRVDCIPSTRHVRVTLGGEVVAESDRPDHPVRDWPQAALLPPEDRRPHRVVARQRHSHRLPLQRHRLLLLDGRGRQNYRGHHLVLPAGAPGGDAHRRRLRLLLRREGRHVRGQTRGTSASRARQSARPVGRALCFGHGRG